ncbi:MAG: dTMP kinase, partial [Clostridiales bacterium]|nr:dTMP kinase [Clostridiales bacterium]
KGLFITFEGIDGCGKSTQTALCREWLESMGREVLMVREPGGTKIGEKIRELLLDKKNSSMAPMTELFLFEAARAQIVEETIKPAIASGKVVICYRFFDSSFAYQGCARGLGPEMVTRLNMDATGGLAPDITFFLDISVVEALKRRNTRGEEKDRIESAGDAFQEKVRDGFVRAAREDKRIVTIDAASAPEIIFGQIKEKLEALL